MYKKIVTLIILIAIVVFSIYAYTILPDSVAMQMRLNGSLGNYIPKIFGVIIPCIITIIGLYIYNTNDDKKIESIIISFLGFVALILEMIIN